MYVFFDVYGKLQLFFFVIDRNFKSGKGPFMLLLCSSSSLFIQSANREEYNKLVDIVLLTTKDYCTRSNKTFLPRKNGDLLLRAYRKY
jgi:hypothetical protein